MSVKRRQCTAVFKAVKAPDGGDQRPGYFEAIVSVFGNVDGVNDRVVKGAFADDINERGGRYPIVWSHQWGKVPIGVSISAEETDEGLLVKGYLLIDDNATALEVYAAFKAGVPLEFSFAYDILDSRVVTEDGVDILELLKLKVDEVGPCLKGCNSATRLVGVKSDASPDELVEILSAFKAQIEATVAEAKAAIDDLGTQLAALKGDEAPVAEPPGEDPPGVPDQEVEPVVLPREQFSDFLRYLNPAA